MKISKMIVGIGILIIFILIVKSIVIPLYIGFFANINIVKYDNCTNVINLNSEELEKYPAIEKVINGEGCSESGAVCIITHDEWIQTKNYIDNKSVNNTQLECFKFENHDGFYNLNFNRP
ncbi:MAG: hypothetical protein WC556_10175 [Candidatus Methanoperedens sp.]